jgi:hypothetical protein
VLCDLVSAHGGVRPVEQGEGDSFVVAFARAADAVACALELQRPPAPIRLGIGVHTGEVQLRNAWVFDSCQRTSAGAKNWCDRNTAGNVVFGENVVVGEEE